MSKKSLMLGLTLAGMLVFLLTTNAIAGTGTVIKYSQPISHLIDPDWDTPEGMRRWGENIPSDVDWVTLMEQQSPTAPLPPNWVIADDFEDNVDLPAITVRWWGSYVGPTYLPGDGTLPPTPIFGPGSEDGYVISFFTDKPGPRGDPVEYSHPEQLLGTYTFNFDTDVRVRETPYIGWDMHPIYEYEVDLMNGHLEHNFLPTGEPGPAMPNGFYQQAGERYWISIMAEVGHKLTLETIPGNPDPQWVDVPSGKRAIPVPRDPNEDPTEPRDPITGHDEGHFWGWHTSPLERYDVATMNHLYMPGQEWIYPEDQWQMIQPEHELLDMAFELLTIPEPTSIALLLIGLVGLNASAHRRR